MSAQTKPRTARGWSHWRPLGDSGAYPEWLRDCRGRNGVYEIRDAETHELLYVGESHTGRLYQTATRHFQAWSGPTAGKRYSRPDVHMRVKVTRATLAVHAQNVAIATREPRDNTLNPEGEETGDASFDPSNF